MKISIRSALLPLAILLSANPANPARADSILSLANVEGIRIWETTNATLFVDFDKTASALTSRIAGALTSANRDFGFFAGDENFDLFFSNANGALDANGAYLTIEGNCGVPFNCFNINGIALIKTGGALEYADTLARAVYGRATSFTAGSAINALGDTPLTYTQMGDTIGLGEDARMSITVGFASAQPVPEPESWALMLAGLGLTGYAVRRRANRAVSLPA